MTLKPIGWVQTPYRQKFGTPRQSGLVNAAKGTIKLDKEYVPPGSLEGLESFSHIWLVFGFHLNRPGNTQGKVQPPRLNGKKMGLFATRSPHRPNPVGLSLVKLLNVDHENFELEVEAPDLVNDTPLYDIKPYIKSYDYTPETKHGWVDQVSENHLEVVWSETIANHPEPEAKDLIEQSLRFDLRNLEDKTNIEKTYKSLIAGFDVEFKYANHTVIVLDTKRKPNFE